jgi:hypothetical protein
MKKDESKAIVPVERIEQSIYVIRGCKVMLDRDLALLYGVATKRLNERVQRNIDRFPEDFAFQLTKEEFENWKSQFATSNLSIKMGLRKRSYAFTEQGVAMLSGVLRSPQAVAVNVEIMRAFIRLRQVLASHKELTKELTDVKAFMLKHSHENSKEFKRVWNAIDKLINPPPPKEQPRIGFDLSSGRRL